MTTPAAVLELAVPYFGRRDLLEELVLSVLHQTDPRWRLLIVEDGDQGQDVGRWLESLNDARITHVMNPRTLGVAKNFQRCLELASADWVAFPGCDDRLQPRYVSAVISTIEQNPSTAAIIPRARVIDEHGRPCLPLTDRVKAWLRPGSGMAAGEPLLRSLLIGNWTYFPAICWLRADIALLGFRPDLSITLDLELLGSLALAGHTITVTEDDVFEYRRHSQSASSRGLVDRSRLSEERLVHKELGTRARSEGWDRAARHGRARVTSRCNALVLMPRAVRGRGGLALLARHAFGP